MPFPFDLFGQAMDGNWVAWATIVEGVVVLGLVCFLIIIWWKMPQLAKRSFLNETLGEHNPTVAQCLETRRVRFHNPRMGRSGFAYDHKTGATYIPPKMWGDITDLKPNEQNIIENIYTIEGSNSPFYLNYSVQAFMSNPQLLALLENKSNMEKFAKQGTRIKTEDFIKALKSVKAEYVDFKAVHFTFPIDVKHLRTVLSQSITQSDFVEFENKIRQDERGDKGKLAIGMLLGIVTIILVVIDLALNFF